MTAFAHEATSIGELVLIAVSIPPRDVERLLDSLAKLPYYINPTLQYSEWQTTIEFPAYRDWLPGIHEILACDGHEGASVRVPAGDRICRRTIWK